MRMEVPRLAWRKPLRPSLLGTTVDLKVQPPPLSEREKLLILSCCSNGIQLESGGSALSQWLVGVEVDGPDGLETPTFLKPNFAVQEAVHLYKEVLEDLSDVTGLYPAMLLCGKARLGVKSLWTLCLMAY